MPGTIASRSWRRSSEQAAELDYAPAFQFGHPKAFELASRIAALAPGDLDHVFFCNSGSEAVDTALKIALAYHNVRGEGARTRLIGRERGYHGVGFGGISVGGIVNNRKFFGSLLAGVDHLPSHLQPRAAGLQQGRARMGRASRRRARAHRHAARRLDHRRRHRRADGGLDRRAAARPRAICKRLRAICDKHGILLIFDEVITGFGRLGHAFAAERYGVDRRT